MTDKLANVPFVVKELMFFLQPSHPDNAPIETEKAVIEQLYWTLAKNVADIVETENFSFSKTSALRKLLESRDAAMRALQIVPAKSEPKTETEEKPWQSTYL